MTHSTKRMLRDLEGTYTLRVMDMPEGSKGCVLLDADDHANIYINARLSHAGQLEAAAHELTHLLNDDIHNSDDIRTVESRADGRDALRAAIPHLKKAADLLPGPPPAAPQPRNPAPPVNGTTRAPAALNPHQAATLLRAVATLDAILAADPYDP